MKYYDIVIEGSEVKVERDADKRWWRRFKIRVLSSPAGEMTPDQAVSVQCDEKALKQQLSKLVDREIEPKEFYEIGRLLGLLLLPPTHNVEGIGVRELFARSLDVIGHDTGLRLRLLLPSELASLPWEYVYLDRLGTSENTMAGFLALDPRVAIIRHEALPLPTLLPLAAGNIVVLAALASPPNLEYLDLDLEEQDLRQALDGQSGVELTLLKDATLDEVQKALPGTSIFHFAGHGAFRPQSGEAPGTMTGTGSLALDDQEVDAETLGANLRGNGVRLVVLGGCETGRRAGESVWGGIAPALVRFQMPAVVAHQYTIQDKCAIAFSRQFYSALAGGLPIERAVSAGRISAYNADQSGRDWGVPVLYLRAENGELFAGAADKEVRATARARAEADVEVWVKEVAAGGFVTGAKVREMSGGNLHVEVTVAGTVYGTVIGFEADIFGGGAASVKGHTNNVGSGGSLTGVKIGEFGR